jgi:predicted MFS family arabinose efflux permease
MSTPTFSRYQKFVVAILAFLQFTIVLDFMILSPLGTFLLPALGIKTSQFGLLVSAYAFSAFGSGLLTAGFADKFDRKKLLLFFYTGFVVGTVMCALASGYRSLLVARIVTGVFGGVIGSISMAIITDLFPLEVRGRVMGVVQTAFAASQVMGLPLGVFLTTHFSWHAPFALIATVSVAVGFLIAAVLQPIDAHLKIATVRSPFKHLVATAMSRRYLPTFAAMILMATGGFMLMPFGSAFATGNLGISTSQLPYIYIVTGITSMIGGPLLGRLADAIGKYAVFCLGSLAAIIMVGIYCHLGVTPIGVVMALNAVLFIAITGRMISASALTSAIPEPQDRGAFMSVSASLQMLAGGVGAWAAGHIVYQSASGRIERYDVLGYIVMTAIAVTVAMLYPINRAVMRKVAAAVTRGAPAAPVPAPETAATPVAAE